MGYQIARRAEEDIENLYVSSATAFGIEQAERYFAGLEAAFNLLAKHPRIARERSEISPPVRVHPYKPHVIIYTLQGQNILILRIRHQREDWISHPA